MLTEREKNVLAHIAEWEKQQFSTSNNNDISLTYRKWTNRLISEMNPELKRKMLTVLDETLFHLQALVQHAKFEKRAIEYILDEARVYNADISAVTDMKKLQIDQLRFIARKHQARQNLFALGQGGLTGAGGLFTAAADLPALLAVNLRTIQLTAMTYGYDLRKPYEMMLIIKLFHAASLPDHLKKDAWDKLTDEVILSKTKDSFFYEGDEDTVSQGWLEQPLRQIAKLLLLRFIRRKVLQGVPVAGAVLGAGFNYSFSKNVSSAAHMFYQKRHLMEKAGSGE